jgi:hypothetical protein
MRCVERVVEDEEVVDAILKSYVFEPVPAVATDLTAEYSATMIQLCPIVQLTCFYSCTDCTH